MDVEQKLYAAADEIATEVVDGAIAVHRVLGPGLLESVYEACLEHELSIRGLDVGRQTPVPVVYRGLALGTGLRIDLLVGGLVVVEVKAVESVAPVHHAQLLSYLRLSGRELGLLLNFNVPLMRAGIKRMVNGGRRVPLEPSTPM